MRYRQGKTKSETQPSPREIIAQPLSDQLQQNLDNLHLLLERCSDIVFKEFTFGPSRENHGLVVFFDGLADRKEIEVHLLKSLMLELNMLDDNDPSWNKTDIFKLVENSFVSMADVKTVDTLQDLIHHLSSGDTILLIDGYSQALAAGTRSWQARSVQTPENEVVVRGPKEGFTETLRFNTALLRRRIKSSNFKIESFVLGRVTKTDVVLCYVEGIAPADLVTEVKSRLNKIDIDGILDSGYLEEFLEDNHYTIFSQIEYTEKPDRVCGHLLEGQVCIIVDGSPIALIAPTSFPRFLIASEDYYERYIFSSALRIMRSAAFLVALLLPSLFVAAITYHPEMIPASLYVTIAAAREGVTFPALA